MIATLIINYLTLLEINIDARISNPAIMAGFPARTAGGKERGQPWPRCKRAEKLYKLGSFVRLYKLGSFVRFGFPR